MRAQLCLYNIRHFDEFFQLRIEIYGFITLAMMNAFAQMLNWSQDSKQYYKENTLLKLNKWNQNIKTLEMKAKLISRISQHC